MLLFVWCFLFVMWLNQAINTVGVWHWVMLAACVCAVVCIAEIIADERIVK